jgi:hypothetical protein
MVHRKFLDNFINVFYPFKKFNIVIFINPCLKSTKCNLWERLQMLILVQKIGNKDFI